jgi:hypothetical protein
VYKIPILILLILANLVLSAQRYSIGFLAGATNNASASDLSGRLYESSERHWGKYLSLSFRLSLNDRYALESGISYLDRNYGTHRTGIYKGVFNKNQNAFVEMPLKGVFRIYDPGRLSFKIFAGFYLSYWISSRISGAIPNILNAQSGNTNSQGDQLIELTYYKDKIPFESSRQNRFQLGVTGGVQIGWTLGKSIQVVLNCDLYQTISRPEKANLRAEKRERDHGFITSAGIMWSLPHSK